MPTTELKYGKSRCEEQCFIIMPFSTEYNEVYNIIKRAAQKCGVEVVRADSNGMSFPISAPFVTKIRELISKSYYIIADISELKANVLYELGLAHAISPQDDVLLIMNEMTDCPSDLYHISYIKYSNTKLSYLYDQIVEFLSGGAYQQDLINYLERHDLIFGNVDRDLLFKDLKSITKELLSMFNKPGTTMDMEANKILHVLYNNCFSKEVEECYRDCYHRMLIFAIGKLIKSNNINDFIDTIYSKKFNEEYKYNELIADIAIEIIKVTENKDVLAWIKDLLSTVSTTSVNIAKYKVMLGLIKINSINRTLIHDINHNKYTKREKQLFLEEILELFREKDFTDDEAEEVLVETIKLSEQTDSAYVLSAAIKLVCHLGNEEFLKKESAAIQKNSKYVNKWSRYEFIKNRMAELNQEMNKYNNSNT